MRKVEQDDVDAITELKTEVVRLNDDLESTATERDEANLRCDEYAARVREYAGYRDEARAERDRGRMECDQMMHSCNRFAAERDWAHETLRLVFAACQDRQRIVMMGVRAFGMVAAVLDDRHPDLFPKGGG